MSTVALKILGGSDRITSKPVDLPADLASAYLALLSQREMLQAERDVVVAERDTVVAERHIAVAQAADAQSMARVVITIGRSLTAPASARL